MIKKSSSLVLDSSTKRTGLVKVEEGIRLWYILTKLNKLCFYHIKKQIIMVIFCCMFGGHWDMTIGMMLILTKSQKKEDPISLSAPSTAISVFRGSYSTRQHCRTADPDVFWHWWCSPSDLWAAECSQATHVFTSQLNKDSCTANQLQEQSARMLLFLQGLRCLLHTGKPLNDGCVWYHYCQPTMIFFRCPA